jgi:hypothetical protein
LAEAAGGSNEEWLQVHDSRPAKVQKAREEGCEKSGFGQYRAPVYGIETAPGVDIRGGIMEKHPLNTTLQKLARSIYLTAIAVAMVGWIWVLFEGIGWVLGV